MSIVLNGTTGITTPDLTSAAGLDTSDINDGAVTATKLHTTTVTDKLGYTPANLAGDVFTGATYLHSLNVSGGSQRRIRTYEYTYEHPQNTGINLMYNSSAYTDVHFILTLEGFHSGRSYQMWQGVFGGYGAQFTSVGGNGSFTLQNVPLDTGRAYLQISAGGLTVTSTNFVAMTIFGDTAITVVNGGMY